MQGITEVKGVVAYLPLLKYVWVDQTTLRRPAAPLVTIFFKTWIYDKSRTYQMQNKENAYQAKKSFNMLYA